jgi:1-acyl-sn-glycerol-3-phosphate acyltransferase
VLHVINALWVVSFHFPFVTPEFKTRWVSRWAAKLLRVLGLRLHVQGVPRPGAKLFVANHVSWLDIMAINAVQTARFVSKAEVGKWPIVGRLVTAGGTLYLQRERQRDAMRVLTLMADALRAGNTLAVFPEGTTGDGQHMLAFHGNLLQSAIDAQVPVQPVALRYADAEHAISPAPAYVGETSLVQSLWWVASAQGLQVHVSVLTAMETAHADRRALVHNVRNQIAHELRQIDSKRSG